MIEVLEVFAAVAVLALAACVTAGAWAGWQVVTGWWAQRVPRRPRPALYRSVTTHRSVVLLDSERPSRDGRRTPRRDAVR